MTANQNYGDSVIYKEIAVAQSATDSEAIQIENFQSGLIQVSGTEFVADTLTYKFSESKDGTYVAISGLSTLGTPASSVWHPIPAGAFAAKWMKITTNNAAAAAATIKAMFKRIH